jgi:hypothetical protein
MLPTLVLEPSNPELWVMALAPLWAVFLGFAATRPASRQRLAWIMAMVCLLGVHNIVAGMGIIKDRESDYNFKKAEWALQHAAAEDVVHTADSFVFTFYLNYWGKAETRNVNSQDWKPGITTYVFDDVFNPPVAVGLRYPKFAEKVSATALELHPKCRKIQDDQFGGIWKVDMEESN